MFQLPVIFGSAPSIRKAEDDRPATDTGHAGPDTAGRSVAMSVEPARTMRSTAFGWDYEIWVALLASYGFAPKSQALA